MTRMGLSRLFIVVPVFNEAPNMQALFGSLAVLKQEFSDQFSVSVILVDDGSSDNTEQLARQATSELDLQVLSHEVNRGPGAAFSTAFSALAGTITADDWVVTMEGDNTSRCELVKQMVTRTREGFDIVLASPYMYGGGFTETSFLRKFLSSGANLIVRDLLSIQGILTVSSFFRLYRGSALIRLQQVFGPGVVERTGFESMVEMVMKMTMLRLSISEVSMQLDSSRRKGKSKMKIMRTIRGYLSLWQSKKEWQARVNG
jgi:dolichol-phosphate mannosyltransferase